MTNQQRQHRNTPEYKEIAKRASYKLRHTEEYRAKSRAYKKTPRYQAYRRNYEFIKHFGITLADYELMLKRQKGVCAICKQKETKGVKGVVRRLAVDHNHQTGEVRGLLCTDCNQTLGHMKENIQFLLNAIDYLKVNV